MFYKFPKIVTQIIILIVVSLIALIVYKKIVDYDVSVHTRTQQWKEQLAILDQNLQKLVLSTTEQHKKDVLSAISGRHPDDAGSRFWFSYAFEQKKYSSQEDNLIYSYSEAIYWAEKDGTKEIPREEIIVGLRTLSEMSEADLSYIGIPNKPIFYKLAMNVVIREKQLHDICMAQKPKCTYEFNLPIYSKW